MGRYHTKKTKKLDCYKELILVWLKEHPDMSAAQIEDWLKEKYEDLNVGESTVRSYVRELRKEYKKKETSQSIYEAIPDTPISCLLIKRGEVREMAKLFTILV